MKKASILILSSSTNAVKGYSVKHCLASIWNQDKVIFSDIEVVIVENSHINKENNLRIIKETITFLNKQFQPIDCRIIDVNPPASRGKARNIGADSSSSDLFVFIDDDTILYSKNAVASVLDKSANSEYGYGANRLWTHGAWFQENSEEIYNNFICNTDSFKGNISFAQSMIRDHEDVQLQHFTFIGNWGYCKKRLFNEVGGYPDFQGRDLEDDFLSFLLFKKSADYKILFQTSVIHVNHEITEENISNIAVYYDYLKSNGIFWFNIYETFCTEKPDRIEVMRELREYHLDYRIEDAYKSYVNLLPSFPVSKQQSEKWIVNNQLSAQDFSLQIQQLVLSKTIDEYVQKSQSHFDDLIPVIEIALSHRIIEINKYGEIEDKLKFQYFPPQKVKPVRLLDEPKQSYNQFPCTVESRKKRVDLLHERFPLTDHLRVGLIGDDDLLSVELGKYRWLETVVIEADTEVIKCIPNQKNIEILEHDLREYPLNKSVKVVKTFITDPPYTLHGAMLFILQGLSIMSFDKNTEQEFYVVLNPSMMGRQMLEFQSLLADAGIWIHEIFENFSQYLLPGNYEEKIRADIFLGKHGINKESLRFSSSSNLYVMRSINPKLDQLRVKIQVKEIYNHFI